MVAPVGVPSVSKIGQFENSSYSVEPRVRYLLTCHVNCVGGITRNAPVAKSKQDTDAPSEEKKTTTTTHKLC